MIYAQLEKLTLQAAVRSAEVTNAADKRTAVIYFIECLIVHLRKCRKYDMAWQVRNLQRELRLAPVVLTVWRKYGCSRNEPVETETLCDDDIPFDVPRHCNTGVTPALSVTQLYLEVENYV